MPTALEVRARRIHGLKPVATEILPRWGKVCALTSRDATKTRGKHFPQRLKCLPTAEITRGNIFKSFEKMLPLTSKSKTG